MIARPKTTRSQLARLRFPLRGRRIDLVPPTLDQIPALVGLLNDPSVARWTLHVPFPYRERDARDWVRKSAADRRSGRSLGLTVLRRSDQEVLGGVGLHHFDESGDRAEVGYWIGRAHRGRGYATEAVQLLLRAGFGPLGVHRVEALVFPRNAASRRVMRRCGFRYEGRLRGEAFKNGQWRATLLYSRLASDHAPRRSPTRGRN